MPFDIDLSIFFFGYVSSGEGSKNKNNKQFYTKLKHFCTVKETMDKTKRLPTEWEKTFAMIYLIKG